MRGLAREGKTPPDGFMAPRYNAHPCVVYIPTHYRVLLVYQTMNSLSPSLCVCRAWQILSDYYQSVAKETNNI